MRIVSFSHQGEAGYGVVLGQGVAPLAPRLAGAPETLRHALAWYGLAGLLAAAEGAEPSLPLASLTLLPVVWNPDKVLCVGINYAAHAAETGRETATVPSVFARLPRTLVGDGQPLVRPANSTLFDYEGELAVIIGTGGRMIPRERALDHVAGYCCFNDASVRDFQRHSVTAGKNFDATGGLGPWMVTADAVADPQRLDLTTWVNGQAVQQASTEAMIHDVASIIAYCSSFTTLEPGDIIATGTPEGVGSRQTPPIWLEPGDTVEVEIRGIGALRNPVVAE